MADSVARPVRRPVATTVLPEAEPFLASALFFPRSIFPITTFYHVRHLLSLYCALSFPLFHFFSSLHLITFIIFITFNIFITVLRLPAVAPLILRSAGVLVRCPGVLSCPRAVADTGARPVRRHASTTVLLEHSRASVTSKSL